MTGRTPQTTDISPWTRNETEAEIYARYNGFDLRYENKDYEELVDALKDANELPDGYKAIKSLRNPVNRVIEVYAANLLPANILDYLAPPVDKANNVNKMKPVLDQVYKWSSWMKQARRAYPTHGELWLKAVNNDDRTRVYPQVIDPRHVMDFDKDERGFLTWLRIDIPRDRRLEDGEIEEYLYVEVWDKNSATLTIWEDTDASPGEDLERLKDIVRETKLSENGNAGDAYTGYDFIPVVHIPFREVLGKKRGQAPYEHAITNIDRANELVTRMHAMMFPDVVWVLGRTGPDGEPLQPIQLEGLEASAALTEAEQNNIRVVEVNGEKIIRLPANSTFDPKVPNLDFSGHIAAVNEEMLEIERLLPELAYYRLRELELSGYAIELALKDLIDRIREARDNLEEGLVRFDQMAITIGQVLGIEGFDIGSFEDGSLEHTFEDRDVFTPVKRDKVEVNVQRANLWRQWADLGILEEMLIEEEGMDPAEAKKIAAKVRPSNLPGLDLFGTSEPGLPNGQQQPQPGSSGSDNEGEEGTPNGQREVRPQTA